MTELLLHSSPQPQFHRLAGSADRESSQIGLVQVEVANLHAGDAAKIAMAQIKVPRAHSDSPLTACSANGKEPLDTHRLPKIS